MSSIIKKIYKEPNYSLYLLMKLFARQISDERFIRWKYRLKMHQSLHLDPPKTFNEKLQWLKLHDQHPEYSQFVDKYEVKKYVAQIIGEQHIIPTLALFNSVEEIDFAKLPLQFVLKCTHNSGGIVICKDKKMLNADKAKRKLNRGLSKNPFWTNREYPYKSVKPRIIAEQYMEQGGGESLRDYKVLCFNGKAKLIELHLNRYTDHHTQDFYDAEWNKTTISQGGYGATSDIVVPRPENFDEMIQLSELLTKDMVHCRVDWYSIKGQLFFGELTFFDGGGLNPFDDSNDDLMLGEWIKLPTN